MKTIKLWLSVAFFLDLTSAGYAQENSGICFLLIKNYAEQHQVYISAKTAYDLNKNIEPHYGSYSKPISEYLNSKNVEEAKLNKIIKALKAQDCYTAEDEAIVKQHLK